MKTLKLTEANRKWWVLAAMTTTISMIFIDVTVLPVVLPTLQRELQISDLGLQWVINVYTLVLAALALGGGRIGDIMGMKRSFCIGVVIFALASAMCGLSHSESWMIFNRGLQGIGGALLLPATQGIIMSHFPPQQRGKALGLFVSIGMVFLALGPLIGGSLTTYFSWHYVFWINLPIALVGLILALNVVPPMPGKKERFDLRGFSILSFGIATLVIAMMQSQSWGWSSPATLILCAIGIFCLIFLFKRKHKAHASIIDFNLIRKRTFVAGSSSIFCNQMIIMVTVFWAIYFQNILGYSPSAAGFYAFMANVPVILAAPLGGYLVDRIGPKIPVMIGFSLTFLSLMWFLTIANHTDIWQLMPTLILFGFGVSMISTPSFVAMMNEVSAEKRGAASGITSTLRQFSSCVGLALFGTVFTSIYFGHLGKSLQENLDTSQLAPQRFEGLLSKTPEALKNLDLLPHADATYVFESARDAFLDGFTRINLIGAILSLVGVLIAWRLMKNTPMSRQS